MEWSETIHALRAGDALSRARGAESKRLERRSASLALRDIQMSGEACALKAAGRCGKQSLVWYWGDVASSQRASVGVSTLLVFPGDQSKGTKWVDLSALCAATRLGGRSFVCAELTSSCATWRTRSLGSSEPLERERFADVLTGSFTGTSARFGTCMVSSSLATRT